MRGFENAVEYGRASALIVVGLSSGAIDSAVRRRRSERSLGRIKRELRERMKRESGLAEGGALSEGSVDPGSGRLTVGGSGRHVHL